MKVFDCFNSSKHLFKSEYLKNLLSTENFDYDPKEILNEYQTIVNWDAAIVSGKIEPEHVI